MEESKRYRLSAEDTLYFLHIPKTAGTSLSRVLAGHFTAAQSNNPGLWADMLLTPAERLAQYRLIRGHYYHYLQPFLQRPLITMTMLRDPIERTISHYEHVRRVPSHFFHARSQSLSLLDFIHDPESRPMVAEFQTRALALNLDPAALAAKLSLGPLDAQALQHTLESVMPPDLYQDSFLARAKRRLDEMAFVGLTERYDDSVRLLCHTFYWEPYPRKHRNNVAPHRLKREDLSPATMDALLEHTRLDHSLYQHALSLFTRRLGQFSRE